MNDTVLLILILLGGLAILGLNMYVGEQGSNFDKRRHEERERINREERERISHKEQVAANNAHCAIKAAIKGEATDEQRALIETFEAGWVASVVKQNSAYLEAETDAERIKQNLLRASGIGGGT